MSCFFYEDIMNWFASGRKILECVCRHNIYLSKIDMKNIRLKFSLVDNGDGTRKMVHYELIVTPQGDAVCRNCGRKIDIEAEEIVVSI